MRKATFILLMLLIIPWSAEASRQDVSSRLLEAYPAGVRFDPQAGRWSFYGIVDSTARYDIPAVTIDLARVVFRSRTGDLRRVWVALGVNSLPGGRPEYYPLGPWSNSEDALRRVWEQPVIRVSIGRQGRYLAPAVSAQEIDWYDCTPGTLCRFAATLEEMHMGLSDQFIRYEIAPNWYPWGFLFWEVSP